MIIRKSMAIAFFFLLSVSCEKNPAGNQESDITGKWGMVTRIEKVSVTGPDTLVPDGWITDSIALSIHPQALLYESETTDSSSKGMSVHCFSFISVYELTSDTMRIYMDSTIVTGAEKFNAAYSYKLTGDSLALKYLYGDTLEISTLRTNLDGKYGRIR